MLFGPTSTTSCYLFRMIFDGERADVNSALHDVIIPQHDKMCASTLISSACSYLSIATFHPLSATITLTEVANTTNTVYFSMI